MASSEDFKKYIQAGKLAEALSLAMSAAVKLQITTRVLDDADMVIEKDSLPGDRLRTQINMVEGQITNEIGEQFTGKSPYQDLKQVHLTQVKEGVKTIQNNLKTLQKLFRLLVAMRQQDLLEVSPLPQLESGLSAGLSARSAKESRVLLPPIEEEYAEIAASTASVMAMATPVVTPDTAPAPPEPNAEIDTSYPDSDNELADLDEVENPEPLVAAPEPLPELSIQSSVTELEETLDSDLGNAVGNDSDQDFDDFDDFGDSSGLDNSMASNLDTNLDNDLANNQAEISAPTVGDDFDNFPSESVSDPLADYGLISTNTISSSSPPSSPSSIEAKTNPSLIYESLADIEPEPVIEPPSANSYNSSSNDPPDFFDNYDEDDDDKTVIQPSIVAYSAAATYFAVEAANKPTPAIEPEPKEEEVIEYAPEDWVDFGENLPVESLSQVPQDIAGVMAATIAATNPDIDSLDTPAPNPHSDSALPPEEDWEGLDIESDFEPDFGLAAPPETNPEISLEANPALTPPALTSDEDWGDLELSSLSSAELSSFADAQEAAWDEGWEEEPEQLRNIAPDLAMAADAGWDDVEEEFNFPDPDIVVNAGDSQGEGLHQRPAGNYDSTLDDEDFELIGDAIDTPGFDLGEPINLSNDLGDNLSSDFGTGLDNDGFSNDFGNDFGNDDFGGDEFSSNTFSGGLDHDPHDPMEDIFGDLDSSLSLGSGLEGSGGSSPETSQKSSLRGLDDFADFDLDI
jgi:hypothetical protein